jgi:hypothetical protein
LLQAVGERLKIGHDLAAQQAILTQWHELMRTGYFAWGQNFSNPDPPFFHFTDRGGRAVERLTRDPGNPMGYLQHLSGMAALNPVADSYLREALGCFVAGLHKAAAVMIGATAESLILELRDGTATRLSLISAHAPKGLSDWRIKVVLNTLHNLLDTRKASLPKELRDEFEAYWMAFAQQIRATRNDAGHPASIDPVTEDAVHASFLILPELARLTASLSGWISASLS